MTERAWTEIGKEYTGDEECRARYINAIEHMKWQELPKHDMGKLELATMPGMGINAAIRTLKLKAVSHIAISNDISPMGFYGIRNTYLNGTAEIYLLDTGDALVVLCTDFTPIEEEV